ncbi:hypothetical protein Asulf_00959 [Archaeoglobus sulfaticallidus PM70-1]|uniref:Uncharacterized protein n=1 Tax=Archaeoglobus sulfaticallidus PM70-1 TaxID=387631 RepID=N0BD81_9EURY|nr:hypothetical protein [Archaeoglobus sulfaticallidus]AGK60963.1 hypothetical protein Asulf_00959 [Archaeoglobus sulfaticallidus PM70-1]
MSSIMEEHPQIITIYSAFIISGAFIFTNLDNPLLKTYGSAFFFIGLSGIFVIIANIYMSKFKKIAEEKTFIDFLNSSLLVSIFLSMIIILVLFARHLLLTEIKSEKDLYFIYGGIIAVIIYFGSWTILLYYPLILRMIATIATFPKKQYNEIPDEEKPEKPEMNLNEKSNSETPINEDSNNILLKEIREIKNKIEKQAVNSSLGTQSTILAIGLTYVFFGLSKSELSINFLGIEINSYRISAFAIYLGMVIIVSLFLKILHLRFSNRRESEKPKEHDEPVRNSMEGKIE